MKLLSSFKPRSWQLHVLRNLKRFNSILVHRGSGKTELAIQILIGEALTTKGKGEHYDLHNSFEYKDIISLTDTNLFDIDPVNKGYEDQGMLNTFRQEYLCEWLEG